MSHIFLVDQQGDGDGTILVAEADWFKPATCCELYFDGVQGDCDHAAGDEQRFERIYTFWNGSNHQSVVLEDSYSDSRYAEITDAGEIAKYEAALAEIASQEPRREGAGLRDYQTESFSIQASDWQDAWWLYKITERDADAEAFYASQA